MMRGDSSPRSSAKNQKWPKSPKTLYVAQVYQQVSQRARRDHDGSQGDPNWNDRAKRSERAA